MLKLTCLYNADGDVVGWFNDYGVELAARQEWDGWRIGTPMPKCRSKELAIVAAELEDVELGDGDRVDYFLFSHEKSQRHLDCRISMWFVCGATSVEMQRFLINKYRRPGRSNRDADLGGPVDSAGVLYVLVVKAPK